MEADPITLSFIYRFAIKYKPIKPRLTMASSKMTTGACFSRPTECHNCKRKHRDQVMEKRKEVRKHYHNWAFVVCAALVVDGSAIFRPCSNAAPNVTS